jgi:hypothetical protein
MTRSEAADLAFIRRAAELWESDGCETGYLARLFTQLALPYRDPGDVPAWGRRNGNTSLLIQPGMRLTETGKPESIGYPYGTIPRLLLTWLSTEAVRTQSPDLVLGANLADFMRQLELASTGGARGNITRLREQTRRLFRAKLSATWDGDSNQDVGTDWNVATTHHLWWSDSDRSPNQGTLMPSTVRLSEEFYRQVIEHPVPLNLDALRALRRSPLRLDIYAWLTYRMSYLRRRSTVSWDQLRAQFGSNFADNRFGRARFKQDFEKHLAAVLVVYRDANVEATTSGVVLRPSPTHVAQRPTLPLEPWSGHDVPDQHNILRLRAEGAS